MQQYGYTLVYVHASTLSSFYIHLHDCSLSDERHTFLPQLATAVFRRQAIRIEVFDIPCSSYKSNEYITPFHHHYFNSNNSDFTRKAKNLQTSIFQGYIGIQTYRTLVYAFCSPIYRSHPQASLVPGLRLRVWVRNLHLALDIRILCKIKKSQTTVKCESCDNHTCYQQFIFSKSNERTITVSPKILILSFPINHALDLHTCF